MTRSWQIHTNENGVSCVSEACLASRCRMNSSGNEVTPSPRTLIAALDAHRGHTSLLNTELEAFSKTDKGYGVAYVPTGIGE